MQTRPHSLAVVCTGLVVTVASDASAYLEPGSSGVIVQMIVASLLGIVIAVKGYYRKLVTSVRNLFTSAKPKDET